MRSETSNAKSEIRLALASLVARGGLIDDVYAALAADQLAVAMTGLKRFKRVLDLHVNHRSCWPVDVQMPRGFIKTGARGANWLQALLDARRVGRNTQGFRQMSTPEPQIQGAGAEILGRRQKIHRESTGFPMNIISCEAGCASHGPFCGPDVLPFYRKGAARHRFRRESLEPCRRRR